MAVGIGVGLSRFYLSPSAFPTVIAVLSPTYVASLIVIVSGRDGWSLLRQTQYQSRIRRDCERDCAIRQLVCTRSYFRCGCGYAVVYLDCASHSSSTSS